MSYHLVVLAVLCGALLLGSGGLVFAHHKSGPSTDWNSSVDFQTPEEQQVTLNRAVVQHQMQKGGLTPILNTSIGSVQNYSTTAIGNQVITIVDGQGNVVEVRTDQQNTGSSQGAQSNVSGNSQDSHGTITQTR